MTDLGEERGDGRRKGRWRPRPVVAWAAKRMRREPTEAEAALWKALRLGQLAGLHFRRQHPIGRFVLDFYCSARQLAVELDGPIHEGQEQGYRDRDRERQLQEHGITVLRFTNDDVLHHLPSVLQAIASAASIQAPPPPFPMTNPASTPSSPASGEDRRAAAGRGLPPLVADRVRHSFAQQPFMATLGAALEDLAPGRVVISMPHQAALTQQHGFVHAGAITSIVDSACGYAALSVMDPGTGVLSVELKVNLLRPAAGEIFRAIGEVEHAGRTLVICRGEAEAWDGSQWKRIALMQATMICLRDRPGLVD